MKKKLLQFFIMSSLIAYGEDVQNIPSRVEKRLEQLKTNETQIEFFGRVNDQYGRPVSGATVHMHYQQVHLIATSAFPRLRKETDGNGLFCILAGKDGVTGTQLFVDRISKDGFEDAVMVGDFEYRRNYLKRFVPDKKSPVCFQIRRKESEQSFIIEKNDVEFNFKASGSNNTRGYDFLESRLTEIVSKNSDSVKSPYCDLQVMASLNTNTATWTVTLRAGGTNDGIIVSDNKLYTAPTNGYVREYSFALEDHKTPEKKFIYVSSRNEALHTRLEIYSVGAMDSSAWIHAMSATNPFGNPDLEPATGIPSGLSVQMRKEVRDSFRNDKRPSKPDLPKRLKDFNETLKREKAEKEKAKR